MEKTVEKSVNYPKREEYCLLKIYGDIDKLLGNQK